MNSDTETISLEREGLVTVKSYKLVSKVLLTLMFVF